MDLWWQGGNLGEWTAVFEWVTLFPSGVSLQENDKIIFVRNLQRRVNHHEKKVKAIQNIPVCLLKCWQQPLCGKGSRRDFTDTELDGFMSRNGLWIDFVIYFILKSHNLIFYLSCFFFVDMEFLRVNKIYSFSQQFWISLNQEVTYFSICFLIMGINAHTIKCTNSIIREDQTTSKF